MSRHARTNGHANNGRSVGTGRSAVADGVEPIDREWSPRSWDPSRAPAGRKDPLRGLIDELTARDLPPKVRRLFDAEQTADHSLGNISEDELLYRRFVLRNNVEMVKASAPPRESIWTGSRRDEIEAGGLRWPLRPEDVQAFREARDAAYARNTRGLDGWQQEIIQDQRREERVVHEAPERDGGILSKLVG